MGFEVIYFYYVNTSEIPSDIKSIKKGYILTCEDIIFDYILSFVPLTTLIFVGV